MNEGTNQPTKPNNNNHKKQKQNPKPERKEKKKSITNKTKNSQSLQKTNKRETNLKSFDNLFYDCYV